jgi:MFS family permease
LNQKENISAQLLKHKEWMFFALLLFFVYSLVPDYGISWDEPMQHKLGKYTVEYITSDTDSLFQFKDKVYGPAWEILPAIAEKCSRTTNPRSIFLQRHYFNVTAWWASCVLMFYLILTVFGHKKYAWLGLAMFICTPRLFAHAFFNSKDIPLLFATILSTYAVLRWFKRPGSATAAGTALAMAWATDIRITGILLPVLMLFLMPFTGAISRKHLITLPIFIIVYLMGVYMFWPYLWSNPAKRFAESFEWMSRFPWDDPVLFEGSYIASPDLPWWYLLEWQAISLPETYVFLYISAWFIFIFYFLKRPRSFLNEHRAVAWAAGLASAPLVAVWIFDSNVYDDWRHLYFTYPGMLLLMLFALQQAEKSYHRITLLLNGLIIIQLLFTAWGMVRWHPNQQVYFNSFAGNNPLEKYDGDYWGLSYKQGFEWILNNHPGISTYCPSNRAGLFGYMILNPQDTSRLKPAAWDKAEWFLNNHRFEEQKVIFDNISYIVESYGNEILTISKMKPTSSADTSFR